MLAAYKSAGSFISKGDNLQWRFKGQSHMAGLPVTVQVGGQHHGQVVLMHQHLQGNGLVHKDAGPRWVGPGISHSYLSHLQALLQGKTRQYESGLLVRSEDRPKLYGM